ncbi:MAG: PDR/VanB family oxidoreductase [Rhizobiaceae bacterium]
MNAIRLAVSRISAETPQIRSFELTPAEGGALPPFEPGAHVRVSLPDGGDRAYSLMRFEPAGAEGAKDGPTAYRIAVRLEEESAGGSRFMHGLAEGAALEIAPPKNDFPLAAGAAPVVLFAGGIGITPITGMVAELAGRDRDFVLHYAGRSRGLLAFVDELRALAGDRLIEHYDDEPETALDLAKVLAAVTIDAHVHVCGPRGMIEAVKAAARGRGFADDHVHFELFTNQAAATAGDAFEIELASTGEVLPVPAGKSIIEVLEEAGHDVLYDCQRGDCGICQTEVISGTPDHRDVVLSDDEKASGKVMQICVSRSKSPRLVLDL